MSSLNSTSTPPDQKVERGRWTTGNLKVFVKVFQSPILLPKTLSCWETANNHLIYLTSPLSVDSILIVGPTLKIQIARVQTTHFDTILYILQCSSLSTRIKQIGWFYCIGKQIKNRNILKLYASLSIVLHPN